MVQLKVRFKSAQEFVVEYAENLSLGGLFIAGAHELELFEIITIELELPRFHSFHLRGRVAHILPPSVAEPLGRRPGAGIELTETPPGFREALRSYLSWLGMRRDRCVVATDPHVCELLDTAGYKTSFATSPDGLDDFVATSKTPVLAILIDPSEAASYAQFEPLVLPLDNERRGRGVISIVDALLISSHR